MNARFVRGNVPLTAPIPLDGYQPQYIQAMETAAKAYFTTEEWSKVEEWTERHFS